MSYMKKLARKALKFFKQNKLLNIIVFALILLVGVTVTLNFEMSEAQLFIRQNRRQAIIISISIYCLLGFTFIPASPLTLFIAFLLGPLQAVLIATAGNTLAAILEYQIGKSMGDVFNFEEKKSNLPFGLDQLPVTSPYFLMIGRILPIGKRGLSIVSGAYRVPMGLYLWTTMLMYIVDAAIVAFGGMRLISFLN